MATKSSSHVEQAAWEAYLQKHRIEEILRSLTSELLKEQPNDAVDFMVRYLRSRQRAQTTEAKLDFRAQSKDEIEDEDDEEDDYVDDANLCLAGSLKSREPRTSIMCKNVVAEDFKPPIVAKTEAQVQFLHDELKSIVFTKHLTRMEIGVLADAMSPVCFAAGHIILHEGEEGDQFYIVQDGVCHVEVKGLGKVMEIPNSTVRDKPRRYFGELALLYDAPRAATVTAGTMVQAWCLDRKTFKCILQDSDSKKISLYARFIQSVPIFKNLTIAQTHTLCQSLTPVDYAEGDIVINQGEIGNEFFVIESGEADCLKRLDQDGPNASEKLVATCKEGDFFGELALLKDAPRAATVKAKTPLSVVKIDRPTFKRMIGSLDGLSKLYH